MGYYRAGFDDITGVDINPMPRYPFKFIQGDALEYLAEHGQEYDVIHASPPCQAYSVLKVLHKDIKHPTLIRAVRKLLIESGKPYVIENVSGAKLELINPVMLCGTMFGLQTRHGNQLRRHRLFELSIPITFLTPPCAHNKGSAIGVYGDGQHPGRRRPATIGVWGHAGGSSERDGLIQFGTDDRREAMGIDWMSGKELSEAIPPAYTEFIGRRLLMRILA
jgi:DNA (cytosine-5)-methyltransferase 1